MQVGLNDWPWLAATLLPFSLMRGRLEWYFYSALFFFCSVFLAVHLFFSKSKSSHFCIFRASRLTSLRRLYLSGRSRGYLYGGWRKKKKWISPLLCSKQEIEFHGQNHPLPLRMKGEKMRRRRRRPKKKKKIFMSASAEASEEKTFFCSGVAKTWIHNSQVLQKPKLKGIVFTQLLLSLAYFYS